MHMYVALADHAGDFIVCETGRSYVGSRLQAHCMVPNSVDHAKARNSFPFEIEF